MKWLIKRILLNPAFIDLIIELVVALSDRRLDDTEKQQLTARAKQVILNFLG